MTQDVERLGSLGEHLQMAVHAGEIGIWELDTVTGDAWRNLQHDKIFGYDTLLDSWTYEDFLRHVVEEDRAAVEAAYSEAIANETAWEFECRIQRADGFVRWICALGKPLPALDGRNPRLIGHVIDITENKRREEYLQLVTAELNHRLQNIIGTISGLISLASREEGDRKEIARKLNARLAAIGRSHSVAFRDRKETVSLLEVMRTELVASPDLEPQIIVDIAPDLHLRAPIAERLTLVLHELMTNSIKYGALSTSEGQLFVGSQVQPNGAVELSWRERGGPPVTPPERKGFGSTLIRSSLSSDAIVDQIFPPEGVVCKITFPREAISLKG